MILERARVFVCFFHEAPSDPIPSPDPSKNQFKRGISFDFWAHLGHNKSLMEISATFPPVSSVANNYLNHAVEGLNRSRQLVNTSAQQIAQGNLSPRPIINLIIGEYTFKANALVVKTQDQMRGTLLNALA